MVTIDETPQTFLRHHRILILSQDVLQLLRSGDKSLSGPSDDRLRELCRIAGPLQPDSDRMEVRIARLPGQGLDCLAKFLELFGRDG